MKKNFKYLLCIIACFSVLSCQKEIETTIGPDAVSERQLDLDENRVRFAKVFAKALVNEKIRSFIKNEALKQFDKDYDVLYQLVKKSDIGSGQTFAEYVSTFAGSPEEFNNISESLPLLTIFVPTMENFSPEKWDVASQIPLVAVLNSDHDELKNSKVEAYDYEGNKYILDTQKDPDVPVIVIKENERIVAEGPKSGNAATQRLRNGSVVAQSEKYTLYFIDNSYNKGMAAQYEATDKGRSQNNQRLAFIPTYPYPNSVTQDLAPRHYIEQAAVVSFNYGSTCHRDYHYFNILPRPGMTEGTFNPRYAEYITSFRPLNEGAMKYMSGNDWAEGYLDIHINILFIESKGKLNTLAKGFSCTLDNISYKTQNGIQPSAYLLPNPIELMPWDLNRYGDTWKFMVLEYDPSGTTKYKTSLSSTYGKNFKFDLGGETPIKVGAGYGQSETQSVTGETEIIITEASDLLQEAVLTWCSPIIIEYLESWDGPLARTYEISTGYVSLGIEPRKRW